MKKTFLNYFDISSQHIKHLISRYPCTVKSLPKTNPQGPCGQHFSNFSTEKFDSTVAVLGKGAASPPAKSFMALNLLAR